MIGCFVEIRKIKGLKVNADKRLLRGEEGSLCEISGMGRKLEHVFRFKYLRSVLNE